MSDEPDNIVLRYLRRIDARMDDLVADLKDVKGRLISLGEQVSLLRSEMGTMRADMVRLEHRIDRMDERLRRIETRLDLIEA
jgi:chromosome segregation ATPase